MSEPDETYTQGIALLVRQAYPRRSAGAQMGRTRAGRVSLAGDMFLRDVLDAAPDALVVVDDTCEVALVNRSAERVLGYHRRELLGQPFGVLVSEHDRDATLKLLVKSAQSVLNDPDHPLIEVIARRKDGTDIPVEVSLSAFLSCGRKIVVAAVHDISTRKRLEHERLELLATERAARLQAETAVQLRDAFLATVTHDLKQPLTIIKARAHLIDDIVSDLADDQAMGDVHNSADRIAAASTRMTAALQELTEIARLQIGGLPNLVRAAVDLAELTLRVADEHRLLYRAPIRIHVPSRPVVGMWDENRLERVLHNLLDNAVKYSPNEGEITITLKQEDQSALIEVSDSGIGIPHDDQERIFDWFRRGTNIAGVALGTGVGLAGARQIVEQHDGAITVRSQVGRGSTFVVRLPLA